MLCDDQITLCIVNNHMFHGRSKHIDIKLYFIRNVITNENVQVVKVATIKNIVDIMSKPIPISKFKLCLKLVRIGKG